LVDEDTAEGLEESLELGETVYLGKDFAFFEAAVDYVQGQLVPEPAGITYGLLAVASVVAAARARKQES
jgi:hypothetical protein